MEMILRSGRKMYVCNGTWGLSPRLELSEGFDYMCDFSESQEGNLTCSEREEIAAIMIDRWRAFAALCRD